MNDAERGAGTRAMAAERGARGVRAVIALSVALFLVQVTLLTPADISSALGFSSSELGRRWWAVGTFTLVHTGVWPLVANLAILGTFGAYLERSWGTPEFIRYYLACGIGAWIAHVSFVSGDAVLTGAAAPSIGVLLAFAAMNGDGRYLRVGAVSLSTGTVAVVCTLVVLVAGMTTAAPGGAPEYLVHLGGLVAGWAYLRTAASLNLTRLGDAVSPVPDEVEDAPPRATPKRQSRAPRQEDDIVARSNAATARESATRQAQPPHASPDPARVNRVLDKISQQGIESLTPDERRLLDDVSRHLRDH